MPEKLKPQRRFKVYLYRTLEAAVYIVTYGVLAVVLWKVIASFF